MRCALSFLRFTLQMLTMLLWHQMTQRVLILRYFGNDFSDTGSLTVTLARLFQFSQRYVGGDVILTLQTGASR